MMETNLKEINPEIEALKKAISDLKWELDRLKHEVAILKINSDSYGRRIDMQVDHNDKIWEAIFKRQII